jgi:hypothetical protein
MRLYHWSQAVNELLEMDLEQHPQDLHHPN